MSCLFDDRDAENVGQKKCHERRGKKQKSQQSLDSESKLPTVAESTDNVQSSSSAAAAAADSADSHSTLVDSSVDVSEEIEPTHGPVIGRQSVDHSLLVVFILCSGSCK